MIVGWRGWVTGEDFHADVLVSPYRTTVWPTQQPLQFQPCATRLRDLCDPLDGPTTPHPCTKCVCGIYAYRHRRDALAGARMYAFEQRLRTTPATGRWIVGQVGLWGRVVEHDRGWRATMARPLCLVVDGSWWHNARQDDLWAGLHIRSLPDPDAIAQVARAYAIPVVDLQDVRWASRLPRLSRQRSTHEQP